MADETTSVSASSVPSTPVQPATTTSGTPPTSAAPKGNPTAPNPTPGQQSGIDPEERIKRLQQQTTLTIRQRDAQIQAAQAELAQMHRRLASVETRDMDDSERNLYLADQEVQRLQREIQQRDAIAAQVSYDMKVNQALYRMASKTQMPFEELQQKMYETNDPDAVWEYAYETSTRRLTAAQRTAGERAAATIAKAQEVAEEEAAIDNEHELDLGKGTATPGRAVWQKALEENDSVSYVRQLMQQRKGKL